MVSMDELAVSFNTLEKKQQSKQGTKKDQPGMIKAKVYATRGEQVVLAFLDNKGIGIIYTNYVPKGKR
jgi:hypothetical protein